jgi:Peptidase family M1 domain
VYLSDHIALPNKNGAMENWGLITYVEAYLLIDPETSPATAKLDVTTVIAHELAHQVIINDQLMCRKQNEYAHGLIFIYFYVKYSHGPWLLLSANKSS